MRPGDTPFAHSLTPVNPTPGMVVHVRSRHAAGPAVQPRRCRIRSGHGRSPAGSCRHRCAGPQARPEWRGDRRGATAGWADATQHRQRNLRAQAGFAAPGQHAGARQRGQQSGRPAHRHRDAAACEADVGSGARSSANVHSRHVAARARPGRGAGRCRPCAGHHRASPGSRSNRIRSGTCRRTRNATAATAG